ncbi:hypothetical protein [Nocardia sp. bgisy134]|uniref:hypothetical protein n=1 Tax=unclassified Nocardia TaxID=2637762 RepID=UPI003D70BCFB
MTDSSSTLGVKTGELGKLSNELQASTDVVKNQIKKISDNLFGPGDAGTKYQSKGKDIQSGLEALRQRIDDWSNASGATADVIGAAVVSYSTVDEQRASELNTK